MGLTIFSEAEIVEENATEEAIQEKYVSKYAEYLKDMEDDNEEDEDEDDDIDEEDKKALEDYYRSKGKKVPGSDKKETKKEEKKNDDKKSSEKSSDSFRSSKESSDKKAPEKPSSNETRREEKKSSTRLSIFSSSDRSKNTNETTKEDLKNHLTKEEIRSILGTVHFKLRDFPRLKKCCDFVDLNDNEEINDEGEHESPYERYYAHGPYKYLELINGDTLSGYPDSRNDSEAYEKDSRAFIKAVNEELEAKRIKAKFCTKEDKDDEVVSFGIKSLKGKEE